MNSQTIKQEINSYKFPISSNKKIESKILLDKSNEIFHENNKSNKNILFTNISENKNININLIKSKIQKLNEFLFFNVSQRKKRIIGIDIARIISAFFIINHHLIYHGLPSFITKNLSFRNKLLLFLNTIFCSGVTIFGMISGFVGFNSYNYANLIYLLFQTSFYNIFIRMYYKKSKANIELDLYHLVFPVFMSGYWYFKEYFSLYFFLPLINSGIKSLEMREIGRLNLSLFLLFSCFNQIKHYSLRFRKDIFYLSNGFSYMWLIILYIFGSYFGRFNYVSHNYNKYITFFICLSVILSASFLRNQIIIYKIEHNNHVNKMIIEYTSPSSVIISICSIILFSKLNVVSIVIKKLISFFAPLTYGIYLIHSHGLVLRYFFKNKYSPLLKHSTHKLILLELFESLKIFFFSSFADYLRLVLFEIFRIRQIAIYISNFISYLLKF